MNIMDKPIWSIEETAQILGRTEGALRWAISQKTAPPSFKLMGRRVFRKEDVLNWINQQAETQTNN